MNGIWKIKKKPLNIRRQFSRRCEFYGDEPVLCCSHADNWQKLNLFNLLYVNLRSFPFRKKIPACLLLSLSYIQILRIVDQHNLIQAQYWVFFSSRLAFQPCLHMTVFHPFDTFLTPLQTITAMIHGKRHFHNRCFSDNTFQTMYVQCLKRNHSSLCGHFEGLICRKSLLRHRMLVINTKNISSMIHDPSCSCCFIYGMFDVLERSINSWQAVEWFEIMNTEHTGE